MFIWDFVLDSVLGQILDWLYSQTVGFLSTFFEAMGNMGAELFEMDWVQAIVLFFSCFAWSLYVVGLLVAVFEFAVEYQTGRASIRDTGMNAVKGFLAVNLFSVTPVELYKFSISTQGNLSRAISGISQTDEWSAGRIAFDIIGGSTVPGGNHILFGLFVMIMMGYAVIKVFFSNLKRGGILLIQIAVGSMYMFSVPRGYIDGFTQWCKQIIGLCLTAFLQNTILIAGLMVFNNNSLLGLGLMLSAGEVPRIAGAFGMDTSTKANLMSAVYTAQSVVNTTRTIVQAVAK